MPALEIENVFKRYKALETVSDVSFDVAAGERVALLGHNGAGKTTIIRMILGLTSVSDGAIRVLGGAPGTRSARKQTGFLPESVAFHGALTGREQLHHFARLKSTSKSEADTLLERVGLADAADRKIRTYSKGMRQRIGLAQVMLGRPKLAVLDEPTSGLDPVSRHEFYDIVDELANNGAAVLLSSHALTELELRTDRVAILSKGKMVANDSLSHLRQSAQLPIRVTVTATPDTIEGMAAKLGGQRVNGQSLELLCQPPEKVALLSTITALGSAVKDLDVTPASLEELYRHFSGSNGEQI
ncbi:ABC transporter ATP-binding protein [Cohaesibacter celericrescens]|uniref:ABC transporter ATP-binding protein n=1 Tax=Cohaesibacter celericrescens TaxID=2067669 RepID=A0A2N5XUE6_9HYPH|nr:ABC transporter ATP-binding protein [Cohaesibacter celericrescens]